MKKYKIIGKTNGWIAQRDIHFNGKTMIILADGLTLKEAQQKLLDFFNEDYNTYFSNWGLVRCNYSEVSSSHKDGTRSYEYDSRYYSIEEEEEEKWYCSSYNAIDEEGDVLIDVCPDCDYFSADSDEAAIEQAKELAANGSDYSDIGHVDLEVIQVCRVDPNKEWDEVETVWF